MWDKRRQDETSGAWPAGGVSGPSLGRLGSFSWFARTLQLMDANDPRIAYRAFLFAIVSWLPLVALAGVQNLAINDAPRQSLLLDLTVYARFLVAIPFFILGESIACRRYTMIVDYLIRSGIIADSERQDYGALLSGIQQLRDSRVAKLAWVILAFTVAAFSVFYRAASEPSTWLVAPGQGLLSWAGVWYAAVSLPLFHFLFYTAVWSWFIWVMFLWRLSRFRLRLTPAHPDLAGGLNILGDSPYAIAIFVFAIGAVLSAALVMQVSFNGDSVISYKKVFIVYLSIAISISFGPLLAFIGKLNGLRLRGLLDYGALVNQQAQFFEKKWIKAGADDLIDIPLGGPDISSLSDLNKSYDTVKKVKFFPFGVRAFGFLAAAALIPSVPLILMEFPLREILKAIAGFIL